MNGKGSLGTDVLYLHVFVLIIYLIEHSPDVHLHPTFLATDHFFVLLNKYRNQQDLVGSLLFSIDYLTGAI